MESTEEGSHEKWKGKAIAEVKGVKAEKVWPLLEDFFGLSKWYPTPMCIPVEGISGIPGCVRFCGGFKTPVDDDAKKSMNWTKQKLLSIDPARWTFTYCIVDSNVGFHSYLATWTVRPTAEGCEVEWLYEVEPVQGWKLEYLESFVDKGLHAMAKNMEQGLKNMEEALKSHKGQT
ncbi:lachrymatory-factor synthase [Vigna radiata var. radiata]|uniref:Lachrymatory-factor synthase n=1 Tax=Vigna radiata var. radiata TaxID=3916 RepID=A0A1S3UT55_VIGRR|nr:lachrymatory-factor synthase [Vigna radiata var. radiata]